MSEPIIHDPGNTKEITHLFVFMSIDENGKHGIVAEILPSLGSTPLITSSRATAWAMRPFAQKVADKTGKPVGLFAFKRSHQLWWSD
jgi:hypothetical protein